MSSFKHEGEEYTLLSDSDLTFGEMCVVERVTGLRFADPESAKTAEFMKAMVWVSMKRKDITLSFDAVDEIPIRVLIELTDDEESEDPKEAPDAETVDDPALSSDETAI